MNEPKTGYAITLDCVHCGLCLPACPTYGQLGDEADSPRGRIYLMRAHSEGRQPATAGLWEHLDGCIVCRACETACPSGVQFGAMMEEFRARVRPEVEAQMPPRGIAARARAGLGRAMLLRVVPHRRRLHWMLEGLRLYQTSGAATLVRRTGLLRALGLASQEALSPVVPPRSQRGSWPALLPAIGRRRARVLFVRGCITPEVLPEMHTASLAALRHNGCDVLTPLAQTCCGALHFHAGYRAAGLQLLAQNVRAFDLRDIDAIIVNAAGCGSTLKEYGSLSADQSEFANAAAAFAARVRDVSEFLSDLGLVQPSHEVRARVAYDEPCHLLHGQRVSEAPKALLRRIPGLELVPLRDADRCCGSGGTYNVSHPELAGAILDEKVTHIAASGADVVATGNPGCILQIRHGLRLRAAADPRLAAIAVVHPMELLARAYGVPAS